MDTSAYIVLTRQGGLSREMQVIANNIANASTTGFRREGLIFSEFVKAAPGRGPSVSMAHGNVRQLTDVQGALVKTGGTFDLAISGAGFFQIETPEGARLTRAGAFLTNAESELVTSDGHRLLDAGGAPVFVPPDARKITLARDGTFSADGRPFAQLGLFQPTDPLAMTRAAGTMFDPGGGTEPIENTSILQGFLEDSNVDPIAEMARMIVVQRAYEQGQRLLEREDERIRNVIQTLGRTA